MAVVGWIIFWQKRLVINKALERFDFMFVNAMKDVLEDAILGPDVRVGAVISGRTVSEVLTLVPDYGTRLVDF